VSTCLAPGASDTVTSSMRAPPCLGLVGPFCVLSHPGGPSVACHRLQVCEARETAAVLHTKGQLVSTHHDTGSSQQSSADGPAGEAWVPEAPSVPSPLRRGDVRLQVGGRTVFAVYVSPVIVTAVSVGLGLLGWGHWPL